MDSNDAQDLIDMYAAMINVSRVVLLEQNDRHFDAALSALDSMDNSQLIVPQYASLVGSYGHVTPYYYEKYPNLKKHKPEWSELVCRLSITLPSSTKEKEYMLYYHNLHITPSVYDRLGKVVYIVSKSVDVELQITKEIKSEMLTFDNHDYHGLDTDDLSLVIDRCRYLKLIYPQLWTVYFRDHYSKYLSDVSSLMTVYKYPDRQIEHVIDLVGNIQDANQRKMRSLHYPLREFLPVILFNAIGHGHSSIGSFVYEENDTVKINTIGLDDNIPGAIELLRKLSKHEFELMLTYAKLRYPGATCHNSDNLVGEDYLDYHPSDRISYCDNNGRIYTFTRDEYKYLMEKKCNPYTTVPFTNDIIAMFYGKWGTPSDDVTVRTIQGHFDNLKKDSICDIAPYHLARIDNRVTSDVHKATYKTWLDTTYRTLLDKSKDIPELRNQRMIMKPLLANKSDQKHNGDMQIVGYKFVSTDDYQNDRIVAEINTSEKLTVSERNEIMRDVESIMRLTEEN